MVLSLFYNNIFNKGIPHNSTDRG